MNAPRVPLALMLLAACGPCGGAPAEEAAEAEEVDPAIYFPMNEGDRWGLDRRPSPRPTGGVHDAYTHMKNTTLRTYTPVHVL